jgi:hypothetical protein
MIRLVRVAALLKQSKFDFGGFWAKVSNEKISIAIELR